MKGVDQPRALRVAVVGVGLIGGSVAAALKIAQPKVQRLGIGTHAASLRTALELGLVDSILTWNDLKTNPNALRDIDVIVLAMPLGATRSVLEALSPHLTPAMLLTDTASVKQPVIDDARAILGDRISQFIPGHPIAGAERQGPRAANAELFQHRSVVLTPLTENTAASVHCIERLWADCGARCVHLEPAQHDAVFAAVSHLPHLLAFAYMSQLTESPAAPLKLALAGSGFRDFTRIAASPAPLWRDICLSNRHALREALAPMRALLDEADRALAQGDAAWIELLFEQASQARKAWALQSSSPTKADHENA